MQVHPFQICKHIKKLIVMVEESESEASYRNNRSQRKYGRNSCKQRSYIYTVLYKVAEKSLGYITIHEAIRGRLFYIRLKRVGLGGF